ncbi:MAG: hypothetical protein ABW199_06325 [Caulobacterales bacterium]
MCEHGGVGAIDWVVHGSKLPPQSAPNPNIQDFTLQAVTSFWRTRALWLAARLGVADAVPDLGASLDGIAAKTGARPAPLLRLMSVLVAEGLFSIEEDGSYVRTPQGDLLRSDHPLSQRALIDVLLGGEHYDAWGALEASMRTEISGFEAHHGVDWVSYYRANPEAARAFARAMTGTTSAFENAVLAADPFPSFRCGVDIGGADGGLIARLLQIIPKQTASCLICPML